MKQTTITVYGIPNCNTVKKAIDWLNEQALAFQFHNYKKEGITKTKLKEWSKIVGWETLLNKKGTTWRGLDAEKQAGIGSEKTAIDLMAEQCSIIKRPVIEINGQLALVGFNEEEYKTKLIKK
ncbi:MAG: ArsC family reductase [Bacteroidota bacterium]|nr:ArsC family reductase [Bacteroidota bacterium]